MFVHILCEWSKQWSLQVKCFMLNISALCSFEVHLETSWRDNMSWSSRFHGLWFISLHSTIINSDTLVHHPHLSWVFVWWSCWFAGIDTCRIELLSSSVWHWCVGGAIQKKIIELSKSPKGRQCQCKVEAMLRQGYGNGKASSRQGQGKFMARSRRGLGKVKARSRQGREARSTTVKASMRIR